MTAQTSTMTAQEKANLQFVLDWWRDVLQARHTELSGKYQAEDYIQHNINIKTGRQGFVDFFSKLGPPVNPIPAKLTSPPVVSFAKGDYVLLVWEREGKDPVDPTKTYKYNTYDLMRLQNGKVQEHWDWALKQPKIPFGGAPDGVDYNTVKFTFTPEEQKNIAIANVEFKDILQYGHVELAEKVMAPTYIQHNPNVPTGRAAFVDFFSKIRKPEPIKAEWKDKPALLIASGPYVFYMFKRIAGRSGQPVQQVPGLLVRHGADRERHGGGALGFGREEPAGGGPRRRLGAMDRHEEPQRLRLFVAYRLPDAVVEGVAAWQRQTLAGAGSVRPTPPSRCTSRWCSWAVSRPRRWRSIAETVRRRTEAARRPSFQVWRYRETPRVGMLTLTELALPGDGYAGRANELAGGLMLDFQAAGIYEPEKRDWKPHITVARFRAAPRLSAGDAGARAVQRARRRPLRIKAQPQRLGLRGAPLNAVHGVAPLGAAANTSPRSPAPRCQA